MIKDRHYSFLDRLFDWAKIGLWEWDLRNNLISFSSLWKHLDHEQGNLEVTPGQWEAIVYPEDLHIIRRAARRVIKGGSDTYRVEFRVVNAHGDVGWVRSMGMVVRRDENNRPTMLKGMQQDISDFKRTEEQLIEKQQHLDLVAEIAGFIPWELDFSSRRLSSGSPRRRRKKPVVDNLPASIDELQKIVHPDDLSRVRQSLEDYQRSKNDKYKVEFRMAYPDGRYLWTLSSGRAITRDSQGRPGRVIGGTVNVHDIKDTQQALRNALRINKIFSERLQRQVDTAYENLRLSEGDLVRQGMLLKMVNSIATQLISADYKNFEQEIQSAMRHLGKSVNADRVYILRNVDHQGQAAMKLIHQWRDSAPIKNKWNENQPIYCHEFGDWYERLMNNEAINSHVVNLEDKSRRFFENYGLQSILIVPIHLDDEFWGAVFFADSYRARLSDEAELKTLQSGGILLVLSVLRHEGTTRLLEAMERAQTSTWAKTQFMANMSHEMRTPMNAIVGMSAIARDEPRRIDECLDNIDRAARKMMHFIDNVLEMSNIEASMLKLNIASFSLGRMFEKVYGEYTDEAHNKGLSMRLNLSGLEDLNVRSDERRLSQVLGNLISNAIKFTPTGGEVNIEAFETGRGHDSSQIKIVVRDTGIGMDEHSKNAMFVMFEQGDKMFTRNYDGAGLGLAFVHGVLKSMGGQILVNSRPGQGSEFILLLDMLIERRKTSRPEAINLAGRHILVVEDNRVNSLVLKAMLQSVNASIECVENGALALSALEASPEQFDVVLMDIHMPVMDGYAASRRIRQMKHAKTSAIPIIAVTSNAFAEDIEKAHQAGMDAHIAKPVNKELLLKTISQYL